MKYWLLLMFSLLLFIECSVKKGIDINQVDYFHKTILKNGYVLKYRISNDSTLQCVILEKKGKIISELDCISRNLSVNVLGFVDGDFEEYFILKNSFSIGSPGSFGFIRKDTGLEIFRGFLVDRNEENEIFIYREFDTDQEEGDFYIYNIAKMKKTKIKLPLNIDTDCFDNYLCLKIIQINNFEIEVEYLNDEFKSETIKYSYK